MYGLVNKAVEEMVSSRFGEPTWEKIKAKTGLDIDGFLSQEIYDDAVTYGLIGSASEILGLTPTEILEAFGEYWILYTAREGYGPLLNVAGRTLPDFLRQLDALHARVRTAMPDARMPTFRCVDVAEGSVRLEYRSERKGLAPLVVGILRGLGKRFKTEVTVVHDVRASEGSDHDAFLVTYAPR